jgi:DNA-binding transcriptional ArsR family regulator
MPPSLEQLESDLARSRQHAASRGDARPSRRHRALVRAYDRALDAEATHIVGVGFMALAVLDVVARLDDLGLEARPTMTLEVLNHLHPFILLYSKSAVSRRLDELEDAGLVDGHTWPHKTRRFHTTADGREALAVWHQLRSRRCSSVPSTGSPPASSSRHAS